MVSTDTGKPATWSAPQHIVMLRSGQFSNRIKNEAVQCGTVSFFIILAESPWSALLAPGENRHIEPGEKRQS